MSIVAAAVRTRLLLRPLANPIIKGTSCGVEHKRCSSAVAVGCSRPSSVLSLGMHLWKIKKNNIAKKNVPLVSRQAPMILATARQPHTACTACTACTAAKLHNTAACTCGIMAHNVLSKKGREPRNYLYQNGSRVQSRYSYWTG